MTVPHAASKPDPPPHPDLGDPLLPIFTSLAEEYGGLADPDGTDWGQPAVPAVGTARVPRAARSDDRSYAR